MDRANVRQDIPFGRSAATHRVRGFLARLAGWVLVTVWITWPLARRATSALPRPGWAGEFDNMFAAWVLAWESWVLTHHPARFADANIFAPEPNALFYGATAFGALPFFAPVYWLTGNPTLAANVLLIAGLALTATVTQLVVEAWTEEWTAGVVAAATLLSSRWMVAKFVPVSPYFAVVLWLPLLVALVVSGRLEGWRWVAVSALVALQCSVDGLYLGAATVLPLGVTSLWWLGHERSRRDGLALLSAVAVGLVVTGVLHAPFVRTLAANPHLLEQTNWPFDVLERKPLVLPTDVLEGEHPLGVAPILVLLVGVGLALRWWVPEKLPDLQRRAWRHATLWLVVGLLASLPVLVQWEGGPPYRLGLAAGVREWLPLVRRLRVPARVGVAALVGMALLAGLAFAVLAGYLRRRGVRESVVALACAVVLAVTAAQLHGHAMWPLRVTPLPREMPLLDVAEPAPRIDRALARATGPILFLPVGPGQDEFEPPFQARAMYRSIGLGFPPIVNGYHGNWPQGFDVRMRAARELPDPDALAELRRATGLELIAIVPPPPGSFLRMMMNPVSAWTAIADAGGRNDLELVARDGDAMVFRVR